MLDGICVCVTQIPGPYIRPHVPAIQETYTCVPLYLCGSHRSLAPISVPMYQPFNRVIPMLHYISVGHTDPWPLYPSPCTSHSRELYLCYIISLWVTQIPGPYFCPHVPAVEGSSSILQSSTVQHHICHSWERIPAQAQTREPVIPECQS